MEKPKPKKEVAIKWSVPSGLIVFVSTKDAIEDIREFGKIRHYPDDNEYWLSVDARYDFDEVVKYIESYG